MFTNFLTVGEQVAILFALICVGVLAGHFKLIKKEAIPSLNNFVLYIVTTMVIIKAFNREFDDKMFEGLGKTVLLVIFIHFISIVLAHIIIHDKVKERECVMRFAVVFSNCGFMSIPLQSALLGDEGVFYGAVYVALFNIFCWTYGVILMSGESRRLSVKKLILNPGVIGVVTGMIIFLLSIKLPNIIYMPISYIAALNTPLPMIIIGFKLWEIIMEMFFDGKFSIRRIANKKIYISLFIRLIVIPLSMLFFMKLLDVDKTIMLSLLICTSAPVAATTTMFAEKFGGDTKLSVVAVSMSTILSLITMPIIVGFAM